MFLIAVHGGAGYHSPAGEKMIKAAMRRACTTAARALVNNVSATVAVTQAISELEDDESINAGHGSNLTEDGTVECDASIMEGTSQLYGAVGALSGVKNPIRVAQELLEQSRIPGVMGRVHPLTLVSQGAHSFATRRGLETVSPEYHVTTRASNDLQKWKARLEVASSTPLPEEDSESLLEDTCGAVVSDLQGLLSSGVSSGGILLKLCGRIGEAAVFGAGCWAQAATQTSNGVACSVSGTGEHIIRYSLASRLAAALSENVTDDPVDVIRRLLVSFQESCRQPGQAAPNVGVLVLTQEMDSRPRLWCGFTTKSFAVAYMSATSLKPKAAVLRQPSGNKAAQTYVTSLPV